MAEVNQSTRTNILEWKPGNRPHPAHLTQVEAVGFSQELAFATLSRGGSVNSRMILGFVVYWRWICCPCLLLLCSVTLRVWYSFHSFIPHSSYFGAFSVSQVQQQPWRCRHSGLIKLNKQESQGLNEVLEPFLFALQLTRLGLFPSGSSELLPQQYRIGSIRAHFFHVCFRIRLQGKY